MEQEVVRYPAPVLRTQAKTVSKIGPDIKALIEHMTVVLREESGMGLSANQVGVLLRVIVYDDGAGLGVMINPKLAKVKGEQMGFEGCLSFPGLHGEVKRANEVVVKGLDAEGRGVKIKCEGILARIFQHEIDHLDGKLFIDLAEPGTLQYMSEDDSEESSQEESA